MISYGSNKLHQCIVDFFNDTLDKKSIDSSWLHIFFTMIPKDGDLTMVKNWRPIAILKVLYKLFARLLYERLYQHLDSFQCADQHAYRKNFSIEDPLFVFEMLTSKAREFNVDLWAASLDLSKAFDTLKHSYIFDALRKPNVEEGYI